MERLAFTSAEDLESYCERLSADLNSRTDEQRQMIETALARLDQLAAQAQAVHSDALTAEIAARKEEGLRMLARLGEVPTNSAPIVLEQIAVSPPPLQAEPAVHAAENGFSAPTNLSLNGDAPAAVSESPDAVLQAPVDPPTEATEPLATMAEGFAEVLEPEITFEAPADVLEPPHVVSEAPEQMHEPPVVTFAAPSEPLPPTLPEPAAVSPPVDETKIEALWQQPVDPFPEPQAFEAPEVMAGQADPEVPASPALAAAVEEPAASEGFGALGAPVVYQTVASFAHFDPADDAAPTAEVAETDSAAVVETTPELTPASTAAELPPALNWAWGAENASPAWAALLVEDAPVPMEPLSDSHFVHAPPVSEIAASTQTAEAPPIAASTPDSAAGLQQLVLNVKVGEWGSIHPLAKEELLVGRRDMATRCKPDVEVMYDQAVSRRHLRIVRDNGHYVVEDLNSTNGTTLNGRSLRPGEPEMLKVGDELEIGEFTLLQIATA